MNMIINKKELSLAHLEIGIELIFNFTLTFSQLIQSFCPLCLTSATCIVHWWIYIFTVAHSSQTHLLDNTVAMSF